MIRNLELSLDERKISDICDRINQGDANAFDDVVGLFGDRFRSQVRRMLRSYPRLRRWEETDDVYQSLLIKLHRALTSVSISSASEVFALAATQIRRTLIDLARHYFGKQGIGANHFSDDDLRHHAAKGGEGLGEPGSVVERKTSGAGEPSTLVQWSEFHQAVDNLPPDFRDVFQLVWYAEMTQAQIAKMLKISERTVLRRLNQARLELAQKL